MIAARSYAEQDVPTRRPEDLPMILLVAGSPSLQARCSEAAARAGAWVQPCDIDTAEFFARVFSPHVIVATTDVCERARILEGLCFAAVARLVRLPDERVASNQISVLFELALYEVREILRAA
jgi:hypothetical protein